MRILNLYIGRSLLVTTLMAAGVLTFVMLSANLMRVFDLLARGVRPAAIGLFLLYLVPIALRYTVPLAVLVAVVLVFGRLSADREITAMRASGVSLWQISAPGLLLALALSAVCFYLQTTLSPRCLYWADQLRKTEIVRNPVAFLDAGIVEFPGYVVYVGKRDGALLRDVSIYGLSRDGKVTQDITAREGTVTDDPRAQQLMLELRQATISTVDPASQETDQPQLQRLAGQSCSISLDYGQEFDQRPLARREKHMDMTTVLACIQVYTDRGIDTTPLYVALHTRMSMALAPLAFLLIGIPFGVRTQRSETSIGLLVSLLLALCFYVFVILAHCLRFQPRYHPEVLVWLPNVVYQIGGLIALARLARQ